MNPYLQQYQKNQVTTADQGRLILMMYEAAMASIKMAKASLEGRNLSVKGKYIGRSLSLINELRSSLNFEQGGEIALNLNRLYLFVAEQLTEANIRNDTKPLDVALKILTLLYEGWTGIFKKPASQQTSEVIQAAP